MTQIEQDRHRLYKAASNPMTRSGLATDVTVTTAMLIAGLCMWFDGSPASAFVASLFWFIVGIALLRHFIIDPLVREVRRLRNELDHLSQPKESAS